MAQVQILLLLLVSWFTLCGVRGSTLCIGFCTTPASSTAILGQETVAFHCSANASSLTWRTSPHSIIDEGNYTTVLSDGGIYTSNFTIPAVAQNNKTNVSCCIYMYRRGNSTTLCANATLLIYAESTQIRDGASGNSTNEDNVAIIVGPTVAAAVVVLIIVGLVFAVYYIKRRRRNRDGSQNVSSSGSNREETSTTVHETTIEMEGKPEVEELPVQEQSAEAGGSLILRSDLKLHQRKISTQRGLVCTDQESPKELKPWLNGFSSEHGGDVIDSEVDSTTDGAKTPTPNYSS